MPPSDSNSGSSSPGARYEVLLQLLHTADTFWNASWSFFSRWDLGPSQFNILNLLFLNPEGLSQTELSRRLIMNRSNVTGLVDRLEERGLLQRTAAESDRRAYRVVLTTAGKNLLEKILPTYHGAAERVWQHLAPPQTAEVIALLRQAAVNAQQIADEVKTGSASPPGREPSPKSKRGTA